MLGPFDVEGGSGSGERQDVSGCRLIEVEVVLELQKLERVSRRFAGFETAGGD